MPAPVRGDDDPEAGRPDGDEQLPDVLAQADRFGDLPQPRVDLAVVGEEVVVRSTSTNAVLAGS
jgi:hypothetical protein